VFAQDNERDVAQATIVVSASTTTILAYLWNVNARNQAKKSISKKIQVTENGAAGKILYVVKKARIGSNVDFLQHFVVQKKANVDLHFVSIATSHEDYRPEETTCKRISTNFDYSLEMISESVTKVTMTVDFGPRGSLSQSASLNTNAERQVERLASLQGYFRELQKMEDLTEDDAKQIGFALYLGKRKSGDEGARAAIPRHDSLRTLCKDLPWMISFLVKVVSIDLGFSISRNSIRGFSKSKKTEKEAPSRG
jgi:hypothetical protein